MKFIMVTNLTDWLGSFDMVAESQIIRPANPNEPLQGHIARTTALRRAYLPRPQQCTSHCRACMTILEQQWKVLVGL